MINPNKYIRDAWISAFKTATGLRVWGKLVPKDVNPIPNRYILISSQSKNRFAVAKDCYEWLCTINVEIINITPQGFVKTVTVDDIEETILNTVEIGITVPGFTVKLVRLAGPPVDMDIDTETEMIERRIISYELWFNKA
ncbi:hypothetical protein G5B30_16470 [Sphingobacterium sp. SGG-5]|uniref:hypothetical protein n=1 Tax=Sphingobacterium sp. SGG-5 TaxID=2710881 RepID=UPI0013EBDC71|nr:hypothetical protein [Sphingobacterium sp. SGG-5]NGM63505.1 hypothetical protein [Sphingobacterium sp. SGG-5]